MSPASTPASRALLDLAGPVAGLDILDVACGHGRITRELARRGANVAGVDISGKLISHAIETERTEPLGIRYHDADVSAVGALRTDAFDLVVCHFGLSDIDDLDGAVAALCAALHRHGRFVFSILHPCFGGGKDIAGSWPTAGSYYDEGRWTAQESRSTLRRQVGAHHRTLSTYLGSLRRAGLWADAVVEPRPAPGWDPAHDADRKPVHRVVRAAKAGALSKSKPSRPADLLRDPVVLAPDSRLYGTETRTMLRRRRVGSGRAGGLRTVGSGQAARGRAR
jgi:SAM-dependent methyltransferase